MNNKKVKIGAIIVGVLLVVTIFTNLTLSNNKKDLAMKPKVEDNTKSNESSKNEKSDGNNVKRENEKEEIDKDLKDKEENQDKTSDSFNNDTSNKKENETSGGNESQGESAKVAGGTGETGEKESASESTPEPKPEVKPEPTTKYVTISITCNTVLNNLDKLDEGKKSIIPSNGVILATQKVEIKDGDTVFDVLSRETRKQRIHMDFVESPAYKSVYIRGINNLYEFDAGDLSGWKYSVNGVFPNVGCSNYQVKSGDVIEWKYTCDLGNDL